ncbi:MAG: SDR family NAD(P)-dependent oxidoreductase [Acidimicrobiales bacterium]
MSISDEPAAPSAAGQQASGPDTAGVAVVTGGGTGIGAAAAVRLARRGLRVICVGRRPDALARTVATIEAEGGRAVAVTADVGTEAAVASIVAEVGEGPVAAVVHSAGRDIAGGFAEATRAEIDEMMAVNFTGPYFITQALLDHLTPGAGIVLVGSVSAVRGRNRQTGYGASKAALRGFMVNLAAELGGRARVNCVSPGATRTQMLREQVADGRRGLSARELEETTIRDSARMLLGRVAEPDEIAVMIEHLALDATAMTGTDVPVDVGYTAG